MVDELSGSKCSRDIANLPYFSESVDLDLTLARALLGQTTYGNIVLLRRAIFFSSPNFLWLGSDRVNCLIDNINYIASRKFNGN